MDGDWKTVNGITDGLVSDAVFTVQPVVCSTFLTRET